MKLGAILQTNFPRGGQGGPITSALPIQSSDAGTSVHGAKTEHRKRASRQLSAADNNEYLSNAAFVSPFVASWTAPGRVSST